MIALCNLDPAYNQENEKFKQPSDLSSKYANYIEWRQQYNACEYARREAAQKAIRK